MEPKKRKPVIIAAIVVVGVLVVLGGTKGLQFKKMGDHFGAMPMPSETVSAAVAREEQWQDTLGAVGSITAVQGVNVTTEIAGTVREIAFESGAVVKQGDLLVRLDTTTEDAQLRATEAQLEWARMSVERARTLRKDGTVSQSELDSAETTWKQTGANADAIRAAIEKKTIRAPFAGRLGIRIVHVGEYLDTGKPIVSLQLPSPLHADFSLPQQELARVKTAMALRVLTDTYPGKQFAGAVTAINPDVDQTTRNFRLQGTLDNPDHLLRPGMFVRVEVLLPGDHKVLVIPATAVFSAPYGDSVYVIESKPGKDGKPQQVVRQQFIRVGRTRGDYVSVETGLKPGDRVASSGVFKLRNGMAVVENNELAPKATEAPKPADS